MKKIIGLVILLAAALLMAEAAFAQNTVTLDTAERNKYRWRYA